MSHLSIAPTALLSLAIATLMSGCASGPPTAQPVAPQAIFGCDDLRAEIARAEAAKRTAEEAGAEAWKAVVPVAVLARYAKGKKAAADAGERLDELNASAQRKGCAQR